jgi:lipopolysaccharide export system permease protein
MNILGHYLGRELLWGVGMTLASLVAIAYFVTFAGEMDHIGTHDFTAETAVLYVMLKMPKIVQEMFPVSILIGGLFSFGGLAATNELTIMRATGASMLGLLWQLRKVGLLLIVVAVVNMEWAVPLAERGAKVVKTTALHQSLVEYSDAFWLRDGDHFVRMEHVESDGSVAGVQWMKILQHGELSEVSFADRATHKDGVWNMEQIRVSRIGRQQVTAEQHQQLDHQSTISRDFVRLASRDPEDLSTGDLLQYSRFLEKSGLDSNRYWHTFWSRIAAPFGLVVMMVMALPFSVSEGRSLSAGRRIVTGVFIGVGFYLINKVLMNTGEIYQFNPVVTVFIVPILFFLSALWMIRRRGL